MAETAVPTNESANLIKGAGFVSLALAIIAPPIGLIASIATFFWARNAGMSQTVATWGIIISIIMIIIGIIVMITVASSVATVLTAGAINMEVLCEHRDNWGWLIDSLRYVCR